jgi:hypothetical protein
MGMNAERARASKKAGRPLTGRTKKWAGRIIGDDAAYATWKVPGVLHDARTTHISHANNLALPFIRQLALALASGTPFGPIETKPMRVATATVRSDFTESMVELQTKLGYATDTRFAVYQAVFDHGALFDPGGLSKLLRAHSSEVLLIEAGRGALAEIGKYLGDFSGAILTCAPPTDGAIDIQIVNHGDGLALRNGDTTILKMEFRDGLFLPSGRARFDLAARLSSAARRHASAQDGSEGK